MTGGEAGMKEYIIRIDETQKDIMGGHPLLEPPKELIRCKDCWKREFDNCPFHEFVGFKPDDNWFCGDGENEVK